MEIIRDKDGCPLKFYAEALARSGVYRFDGKDISQTTHKFLGKVTNVCDVCGITLTEVVNGGPIYCEGES